MSDNEWAICLIAILFCSATLLGSTSYTRSEKETADLTIIFEDNFSYTAIIDEGTYYRLSSFPDDMYIVYNSDVRDAFSFSSPIYRTTPKSMAITWGDRLTENPRPSVTINNVPTEYWVKEFIYIPVDYNLKSWQLLCEPFTGTWLDLTLIASIGEIRRLCVMYLVGSGGAGTGPISLQTEIDQGEYPGAPGDWTTHYNSGDLPLVNKGEWHELKYHIKIGLAGRCEVWWKAASVGAYTKVCDYSGDTRSTHDSGRNDFVPIDHYKQTSETTTTIYLDDLILATTEAEVDGTVEPPDIPIPPTVIHYYYVNVSSAGNGQVFPSGTHRIPVGQTFSVVATANIDYLFFRWKLNGFNVSSIPTYTLSGIEDLTYNLAAYFVANPPVEPDPPTPPSLGYFSINIGTSTGGTTDLTGNQTYEFGETATVTITSIKDNHRFNYYLLDNVNWGSNQTFTLAGALNTSYTLLPVFQYVAPPLPNEPFQLPSQNVGKLTRGTLTKFFGYTKNQKPIELNEILKQLGRR